jgi:hypothetical protein
VDEEMHDVHLIITDEGRFGFYADSPQLPGFTMGRDTKTEFLKDYKRVLPEVITERPYRVIAHVQQRFTTPEGVSCLVRVQEPTTPERESVHRGLTGLLQTTEWAASVERMRMIEKAERNLLQEVVFVCAGEDDQVRDIVATLQGHDDVVTVVVTDPDDGDRGVLWTSQMASRGPRTGQRDWPSMAALGITEGTKVRELVELLSKMKAQDRHLVLS